MPPGKHFPFLLTVTGDSPTVRCTEQNKCYGKGRQAQSHWGKQSVRIWGQMCLTGKGHHGGRFVCGGAAYIRERGVRRECLLSLGGWREGGQPGDKMLDRFGLEGELMSWEMKIHSSAHRPVTEEVFISGANREIYLHTHTHTCAHIYNCNYRQCKHKI